MATPFADRIRLGGTMEFDGMQPRFDQCCVDAIVASLRTFVELDFGAASDTWAGEHGMFGLSLAPATALVVSELIGDGRADTDLAAFHPDRFTLRRLVA